MYLNSQFITDDSLYTKGAFGLKSFMLDLKMGYLHVRSCLPECMTFYFKMTYVHTYGFIGTKSEKIDMLSML